MKLSCFLCQMACHDGCHVGGPGLLSGLQVPWGHLYILTSQPGAWHMGVVSKCPLKSWRGDTDLWRPYQPGARPNSPSTPDCRCRGLGRSPMPESRSIMHAVIVTTLLLLWKFKEIYAHWLHSSKGKIRAQCLFLTMVITTGKDWADGQSQGCATLGDTEWRWLCPQGVVPQASLHPVVPAGDTQCSASEEETCIVGFSSRRAHLYLECWRNSIPAMIAMATYSGC